MNRNIGHSESAVAVDASLSDQEISQCRGVYVGGAGDLIVRLKGRDADVTFVGVPAGSILPIGVTIVRSTSTATNLVALY